MFNIFLYIYFKINKIKFIKIINNNNIYYNIKI